MNDDLKKIIESLLFVSGDEGLSLKQLSEVLEINAESLSEMLDEYIKEYNNSNHGLEIVLLGGVYKLVTVVLAHPYIQKLYDENSQKEFSQAALETLAIIAYNQPITRVEIEEIRGVNCDMMIRKLLAKDLIEESGRLTTPGLPYTYSVTKHFMDTFSLASLKELPELPDYQNEKENGELFD